MLIIFLRKKKTKNDIFAFCGLCGIVMLALLGIIISVLTRPLLVDRYLYPALGLVFLFFSVECGAIPDNRIVISVISALCIFSFSAFYSQFKTERNENRDFERFYSYISENINDNDLFVFPKNQTAHTAEQLMGICAYLFPGHTHIYEYQASTDVKLFGENLYWRMFNSYGVAYEAANGIKIPDGRTAWFIVMDRDINNEVTESPVLIVGEYHGSYGWGNYSFRLYSI
jgi:hypothetical protein